MEHLANANDLVTLYRLHPGMLPSAEYKQGDIRALFLDTETTGLKATDRVIEIALVPFWFNERGVVGVGEAHTFMQDPGFPIPEEATATNGITNEMVAGKAIPWDIVIEILNSVELVVCHNTKFDRPVVHREIAWADLQPPPIAWACSMSQVEWKKVLPHPPSVALGSLAAWTGFYFSAHRAEMDCLAAIYLLHKTNQIWPLYHVAMAPKFLLRACGAPFAFKDTLKDRGYAWDGAFLNSNGKSGVWWISKNSQAEMEAERAWLTLTVYNGRFQGHCVMQSAKENFL